MSGFLKLNTQYGKEDDEHDENDDPEKHRNFREPTQTNARTTPFTEKMPLLISKTLSDTGQQIRRLTNKNRRQSNANLQNHLSNTLAYHNMQLHDKSYNKNDIENDLKNDVIKIINSASDDNQLLHLNQYVSKSKYSHTPAYEIASKLLDTALEEKELSRDRYENLLGGSYKTRRRRSLKKSRRVKRRKTNATRKFRK
jgi:hypothetical protein